MNGEGGLRSAGNSAARSGGSGSGCMGENNAMAARTTENGSESTSGSAAETSTRATSKSPAPSYESNNGIEMQNLESRQPEDGIDLLQEPEEAHIAEALPPYEESTAPAYQVAPAPARIVNPPELTTKKTWFKKSIVLKVLGSLSTIAVIVVAIAVWHSQQRDS